MVNCATLVFSVLIPLAHSITAFQKFSVGNKPIRRAHSLTENGVAYIPEPHKPILQAGYVTGFKFYALRRGIVYIEIWRRSSRPFSFTRVSSTMIIMLWGRQVKSHLTVGSMDNNVLPGDLVGFRTEVSRRPQRGLIPYSGSECWTRRSLISNITELNQPRRETFHPLPSGTLPCRQYSLSVQLSTGVRFGHTVEDRPNTYAHGFEGVIFMMNVNRTGIPWDGKVVGWTFYGKPNYLDKELGSEYHRHYFQVFRPLVNDSNEVKVKIVGQTRIDIYRKGFQKIQVPESQQFTVKKGDLIGYHFLKKNAIPFSMPQCSEVNTWFKYAILPKSVGSEHTLKPVYKNMHPCRRYSLQVVVDPKL